MTPRRDYRITSSVFLAKAFEALEQRDLLQASEKGWGAAAQITKALAARRGWQHNGHAALFQAVGRLVAETHDSELASAFHLANLLHQNFYENWLPEPLVRQYLNAAQRFVEEVESLI